MRSVLLFLAWVAIFAHGSPSFGQSDDSLEAGEYPTHRYKLIKSEDRETLHQWHLFEAAQRQAMKKQGKGSMPKTACSSDERLVNARVAIELGAGADVSRMPCPSKEQIDTFARYLVILRNVQKIETLHEFVYMVQANRGRQISGARLMNYLLGEINGNLEVEMTAVQEKINQGSLWPGKKSELISKEESIRKEQEEIQGKIQFNTNRIKDLADHPEHVDQERAEAVKKVEKYYRGEQTQLGIVYSGVAE
jgi:hypothetical protein